MEKTKFYTDSVDMNKFLNVVRKLFREYADIQVSGTSYRFSNYLPGTIARFLANIIGGTATVSLLELLIIHIPKRLSYYKSGGMSFTAYYLVNIMNIIQTEPQFAVSYVMHEFEKIKNPFNSQSEMDFFRSLEELKADQEDFKKIFVVQFEQPTGPNLGVMLNSMGEM